MATVFALSNLYNLVVARFASDGSSVQMAFGWRAPGKNDPAGPRIVWIPGDESGAVGELEPALKAAMTAQPTAERTLANLAELFTVEITTSDTSAPEDELKQYEACRALFDAWWRAVFLAGYGNVSIQSADWMNKRNVRRHGAGIRVVCTVTALIPDTPYTVATADTQADTTTTELDNSEEDLTSPEPES